MSLGGRKAASRETAQNRGQARAGFFTGIVAIVLAIANGIAAVILFSQ